jgi:hypothetical protein
MESRRKKVEQKGRFTITEILPGSPYSPRLESPTFQDDEVSVADFPAADEAPTSMGSNGDAASIQPQPTAPKQLEAPVSDKLASNGPMELPALKAEDPPETHTQPPEAVSVPPVPIDNGLSIVPDVRNICGSWRGEHCN